MIGRETPGYENQSNLKNGSCLTCPGFTDLLISAIMRQGECHNKQKALLQSSNGKPVSEQMNQVLL